MPLLSTHANLPAVVSIIALSGSILLPSLRAARAQSGPAASFAILAGVSNGIRTYTDPDVGNAGFEDGACNAPPPEWRWFHTTNPGAGGYALTRCVGGVPEGAKAVQLLRNDPAGDSALDKDTPALRFPVSAGRIYNLDYAARIAGPATNHSAALQWHAAAADGNLVSNSTANVPDAQTSWEYFGLSARAPAVAQGDTADASHAAIRFAINGTGNIYLDDVDMRDVTYNQNRILNGGFENSPNTTPRPVTWTVINTPVTGANTTQVLDSSQGPIYAGSYVLLMHRGSTTGGNDFALQSAPIAVNHGEEIQVTLAGRRASSVGGSTLRLRLTVSEFDNGAPVGTPQTTLVGPFPWPTSQYQLATASFTVGASTDTVALTIRVVTPGDAPSVHDIYLDGISIIVPANDCNGNGDDDANDVANGVSLDCNSNGVPDECDASFGTSTDCQPNGIPDECETDCNNNGLPDFCDINYSTSADCQRNGIPDECEIDCDADGTPDDCELDCDLNGTPDDCEPIPDCNTNGRSDVCDVGWGTSPDLNTNGIPDECEPDCNTNGRPDDYDIVAGTSTDCDSNGVPDECEGVLCVGACGDLVGDGFIDLDDYAVFHGCLGGPGASLSQGCAGADLDGDLDTDLIDYALFAERSNAYAGLPPGCVANAPVVRSDRLCYVSGETAMVDVDVPAVPAGTLELLLFQDTDDEIGLLVAQQALPLSGLGTYSFSLTPPTEGMYGAVARLLDDTGEELGVDALGLGFRPPLAQVPADICAFEPFSLDASLLRSQVEAAASSQTPMPLDIGSRHFEVLVEPHDELVTPEVLAEMPSLGLFRGSVVNRPDSQVRITFIEGLAHASVDPGAGEPSVMMEPVYAWDQGVPFDAYVGYRSDHVRIPLDEHEPEGARGRGAPPKESGEGGGRSHDCPAIGNRIDINLYWDNDPFATRVADFNNMDATFFNRLSVHLKLHSQTQLNTNNYHDDNQSPDTLDDFMNDPLSTAAGVDVAMLFTDNPPNINYGGTLGRAWWTPGELHSTPYCWVKRTLASAWQKRIVGCQELSHNLGASECLAGETRSDCAHRNTKTTTHCHVRNPITGRCVWSHTHYSIMRSTYSVLDEGAAEDKWLAADKTTLLDTIQNTGGHFCN